jgi:hypothetical protein
MMSVNIRITPSTVSPGGMVTFRADPVDVEDADDLTYTWSIRPDEGDLPKGREVSWTAPEAQGVRTVQVAVARKGERGAKETGSAEFEVVQRVSLSQAEPLSVSLRPPDVEDTTDQALWEVIRLGSEQLKYERYEAFMNAMFCRDNTEVTPLQQAFSDAGLVFSGAASPFADMYSYKLLKVATEAFLMANCAVPLEKVRFEDVDTESLGLGRGNTVEALWRRYLEFVAVDGDGDASLATLPYLALVRKRLPDVDVRPSRSFGKMTVPAWELCYRILEQKFRSPCLIELLWSYWMEEGGLVQTLNAVSLRFQNRRGRGDHDPLSHVAIDPLRPLNNLLWGYVQDEQHRLSLVRRAHEYDHEYGLSLYGRAVPRLQTADSRSRFLEAFHNLLTRASAFYRDDDDTTTIADAFPVLNALREVHLLLSEGAHNQYGDLPWTARHEMLIQQWILARGEFDAFLPARVMVVYPEPWMDRVDTMKKLQGWTDVSIRHFRDLAIYGEQILLSARFGNWSNVNNRAQAANWARFWRVAIQWYIHSYRAVTGVDLASEVADTRPASERNLPPSIHLKRREQDQRREIEGGASEALPAGPGTPPASPQIAERSAT